VTESASREQSSSQHRISTWVPLASRQWVKSACQRSFGCWAANRMYEDLGRFAGVGSTRPAVEEAAYRGGRDVQLVVVLEVPGDGVWPGVESFAGQGVA
jgi:hypothetical protein